MPQITLVFSGVAYICVCVAIVDMEYILFASLKIWHLAVVRHVYRIKALN